MQAGCSRIRKILFAHLPNWLFQKDHDARCPCPGTGRDTSGVQVLGGRIA